MDQLLKKIQEQEALAREYGFDGIYVFMPVEYCEKLLKLFDLLTKASNYHPNI